MKRTKSECNEDEVSGKGEGKRRKPTTNEATLNTRSGGKGASEWRGKRRRERRGFKGEEREEEKGEPIF